ncbi:hypothetical protein JTE90_004167 [Oedothorax gibbosus]|uniref:YqaJ viral recombinase domain-containing protein n=1 Tax=Oedothorax gibbosus TaxID=931172 RepID=A0AAV6TVJ0_9ARAC|nr:hypothetical protein JTE90_004167 [Oedothorax gibbosus]
MMAMYLRHNLDFTSAEIRGVKADRSARESFGDNATGYVQVKREGALCIVKVRVTPEHKHGYIEEVEILQSHQKSATGKKSSLSAVGTSKKFVRVTDLGSSKSKELHPVDTSYLAEFLEICQEKEVGNIQLTNMFLPEKALSIHSLHVEHLSMTGGAPGNADDFIRYMRSRMTPDLCKVAEATTNQAGSDMWHRLRYGRITASKACAASKCKTIDGALVENIFGASFKPTNAMKRGVRLESEVLKVIKKTRQVLIKKCGLYLSNECPILGASPDAIAPTFVVEIKCPISDKTKATYINGSNLANKHFCQIQMHFIGLRRGLFCIAEPDFEQTKAVTEVWVKYDRAYCEDISQSCLTFWSQAIFARLNAI